MFDKKTENLLRSLFGTDQNGNVFLRVTGQDFDKGDLKNAVTTQSNRSLATLIASSVVLDADGNPALRLGSVPFGMSKNEYDQAKRLGNIEALEVSTQSEEEK